MVANEMQINFDAAERYQRSLRDFKLSRGEEDSSEAVIRRKRLFAITLLTLAAIGGVITWASARKQRSSNLLRQIKQRIAS